MSQKILNETLQSFFDSICSIQHYQRIIKRNTEKEIKNLVGSKERLAEMNEDIHDSVNAFYFYCCIDGQAKPYNTKKTSLDDEIELLHFHKNKQYQWLLSEAYELFEDYLEQLYGCIGFIDNSIWQANDFGDISILEIKNKDLAWFQGKASQKNKAPKSILSQLRRKYDNLEATEKDNKLNTNLRFKLSLIENLRHIIVHRNGKVHNKKEFIKKVTKEANVNDKNELKSSIEVINSFFGSKQLKNLIVLVEKPVFQSGGFSMHINRHENLISELLAYAYLLHQLTVKHLVPTT